METPIHSIDQILCRISTPASIQPADGKDSRFLRVHCATEGDTRLFDVHRLDSLAGDSTPTVWLLLEGCREDRANHYVGYVRDWMDPCTSLALQTYPMPSDHMLGYLLVRLRSRRGIPVPDAYTLTITQPHLAPHNPQESLCSRRHELCRRNGQRSIGGDPTPRT